MSFEPPSSSEMMWSISSGRAIGSLGHPVLVLDGVLLDRGTLRMVLVRKPELQRTARVSPE